MVVSACVFDDGVGIYFMYMLTVTIYRRKNQSHPSLLTFSKTSTGKKASSYLTSHLTSYLLMFLSIYRVLVLFSAGTDHQLSPNLIFSQPAVPLTYVTDVFKGFSDE